MNKKLEYTKTKEGAIKASKQFASYEKVRLSGVTNMFDVNKVSYLSGLSRECIILIMSNYEYFRNLYLTSKTRG